MGLMQLAELEFGQAEEASGHEIGVCVWVWVCVRAHTWVTTVFLFFLLFILY